MLLNREPFFNENHLSTDINSKNTGFYPLQTINDNYSIVNHISYDLQGMSCEGACAHAHMRCAVARVRATSILESVRDVRACGPFMGVRCAIARLHLFSHFFGQNCQKMLCF